MPKKKAEKKESVKANEIPPLPDPKPEDNIPDDVKPLEKTKKDKNEWGKLAGQCSEKGITVEGSESVDTLKNMLNA